MTIFGTVASGFEPIRQVMLNQLARGDSVGTAFCVYHQGRQVVNLWGGHLDAAKTRPWQRESVATVWSTAKGVVALTFQHYLDHQKINLHSLVSEYWPEFACHGKEAITISQLLNHRSGLIGIDPPVSTMRKMLDSHEVLVRRLESQAPAWEPGQYQGYCAITWGLYVKVLFEKMAGQSFIHYFNEHIAKPLSLLCSFQAGAFDAKHKAQLIPFGLMDYLPPVLWEVIRGGKTPESRMLAQLVSKDSDAYRALSNPNLGAEPMVYFNHDWAKEHVFLSGSLHTSAQDIAKLYNSVLVERAIWSEDLVERLIKRSSWSNLDRVLRKPVGFSYGLMKEAPGLFSPNMESFGHSGTGGSVGWCDPKAQLAFGYVMNKMSIRLRSPEAIELCQALYRCLSS